LVRRAREVLATAVMRIYGSSEFPTFSASSATDDETQAAETDGTPIGLAQFRLAGGAASAGGAGAELVVRGPELFLGYLDPTLNEGALRDGWFHTGDLAELEGDAIVIRGRAKDIIIRGGENLSAAQIEAYLYDHPAVREVAVVAMPDAAMGEKACAVVVAQGVPPDVAELARWLETKGLARQKYPERVEIVDALPKTPSGKVQKYLLRQRVL
jgi:cyclohexanecarboxylate-CoA ligase